MPKKKKAFGYFSSLKPDAGNVEYNNAVFNSMMMPGGVTASEGNQAMSESKNNKILYVIKDKHGNQLSAPNYDDAELWDRVEAMEARGRRGLSVVVYVDTNPAERNLEENLDSTVRLKMSVDDLYKYILNDDRKTFFTISQEYNLLVRTEGDDAHFVGSKQDINEFIKDYNIKDIPSARYITYNEKPLTEATRNNHLTDKQKRAVRYIAEDRLSEYSVLFPELIDHLTEEILWNQNLWDYAEEVEAIVTERYNYMRKVLLQEDFSDDYRVISYDEALESMIDNASDEDIDYTIKQFKTIARKLLAYPEDLIIVEVPVDEYDPEYISGIEFVSTIKSGKDGVSLTLYKTPEILFVESKIKNPMKHFLYFRDESDFMNFLKSIKPILNESKTLKKKTQHIPVFAKVILADGKKRELDLAVNRYDVQIQHEDHNGKTPQSPLYWVQCDDPDVMDAFAREVYLTDTGRVVDIQGGKRF